VLPAFVNTMKVSGVQTHTHTHREKSFSNVLHRKRKSLGLE